MLAPRSIFLLRWRPAAWPSRPSQAGGAPARKPSIIRHAQTSRPLFDSDDYDYEEAGARHNISQQADHHSQQEQQSSASGSHDGSSSASTGGVGKKARRIGSSRRREPLGPDPEAVSAGEGVVGLFVAGWMALISLLVRLLQPLVSLGLLLVQPLTHMSPSRARARLDKLVSQLPDGFMAKVWAVWEAPMVRGLRITASVANWGVRLPAIAAILLTQGSALATQVSLPMLAPLLLGTGMMMRSIKANASFIIPRLGLMVVLLWVLWFVNSVIQTTWLVLRNQGRIDARTLSGARMMTEVSSLLLAGIVVLSMLGLNVNALLLPAGVVLAIASRDLLQNLIAGFYLVLVQPFRLGDRVAVSTTIPVERAANSAAQAAGVGSSSSGGHGNAGASGLQGWFEGVCEKVDLRYTVLRDGRRRLMVPNGAFVSREFLVYDELPADTPGSSSSSSPDEPVIREGHVVTELPPAAAQPLFTGVPPGMTFIAPGPYHAGPYHQQYQQHFAALHYQPPPFHHQQQQPDGSQGEGLPAAAGAAADAGAWSEAGGGSASDSPQLQQQHSSVGSNGSSSSHDSSGGGGDRPAAAGYLFPVYYNVSGLSWTPPGSSSSSAAPTAPGPVPTAPQHVAQQHSEPSSGGMHQPVSQFQPQGQQPPAAHTTQARAETGHHQQQPHMQPPPQTTRHHMGPPPQMGGAGGAASPHASSGGSCASAEAQQQRATAVMNSHVASVSSLPGNGGIMQQQFGVALPAVGGYAYYVAGGSSFEPAYQAGMHHVLHYQQQYHIQQQQQPHHYQQQPHQHPHLRPSQQPQQLASQPAAVAATLPSTAAAGDSAAEAAGSSRASSPTGSERRSSLVKAAPEPAVHAAAAQQTVAALPLTTSAADGPAWPLPLPELPAVRGLAAAAAAVAGTAAHLCQGISVDQIT